MLLSDAKQRSKSALSLSYHGCHIGTAAPTRSDNFAVCKQRLRLVPRGAQLCHYCHLVDGGETEID